MFRLFFPVEVVIKNNRTWIFMAASVFLAAALLFYFSTYTNPQLAKEAAGGQIDQLEELFSTILGTHPIIGAIMVFMNNFLSMAQMLLLGFLAGISPLVTLGLNGSLVGSLLAFTTQEGIPLLPSVMFGLMPHGIFELFAFFLCGAIGLKFGYHCVAQPLPGKNRLESFRYIWKEAISILPLVVLLLLIAAFVEILITPHLLDIIL